MAAAAPVVVADDPDGDADGVGTLAEEGLLLAILLLEFSLLADAEDEEDEEENEGEVVFSLSFSGLLTLDPTPGRSLILILLLYSFSPELVEEGGWAEELLLLPLEDFRFASSVAEDDEEDEEDDADFEVDDEPLADDEEEDVVDDDEFFADGMEGEDVELSLILWMIGLGSGVAPICLGLTLDTVILGRPSIMSESFESLISLKSADGSPLVDAEEGSEDAAAEEE